MSNNQGHPPWWDPYSCQPYKMADEDKPRNGTANLLEYSKVAGSALVGLPAIIYQYLRLSKQPCNIAAREFVGLSINADTEFQQATYEMVDELGVKELLLRVPVWETEHLEHYHRFLQPLSEHGLLINILQDRRSVQDLQLWQQQVREIIDMAWPYTKRFWIGNAINRTKWGCVHSGEYLRLQETVEALRADFPGIKLLGSSVIDFEPLVTWRTLWNACRYNLDANAALLYVNRRHSPFGTQYGIFDLENKLRLIKAMTRLANRSEDRLWITETNWPLLDTKPYTPNSGHPSRTVDEPTQAKYLQQYYQIAWQTGWVEKVYWWQLINPGYGLVDHRNGLRKMPAYYAFKELLEGSVSLSTPVVP